MLPKKGIVFPNGENLGPYTAAAAKPGSLSALSLFLRGVCGAPKRARIDTIGMVFEHRVVELARSLRRKMPVAKIHILEGQYEVPSRLAHVRYRGQTGQYMLSLRFSQFDP